MISAHKQSPPLRFAQSKRAVKTQFATKFQRKPPAPSGTALFQHRAAKSATALQGAGWVLPVVTPKGVRNASPMRNIELLSPGFALPLWLHPFLKTIIQSTKKSTGRTPKSFLLSNC